MARPVVNFVCDDHGLQEKMKSWGFENGCQVNCYTHAQWNQGFRSQGWAQQLATEPVSLTPGTTVIENGFGKVLNFPTPGSGADKKVATMDELESVAIKNAIFEYKGNLTEAAKALGIGRATLYRKVKQYNIDPSEARHKGSKAA